MPIGDGNGALLCLSFCAPPRYGPHSPSSASSPSSPSRLLSSIARAALVGRSPGSTRGRPRGAHRIRPWPDWLRIFSNRRKFKILKHQKRELHNPNTTTCK